ncbi:pectin esterase [Asticcacaulis sp. DW145]|uniref:pectinesterase family protein n=1 Tax=Asticcacaulis sp. DW145 TaxID=3095608 RepID=UPI00308FE621|nr:pectin esterase [Asticcacaulis sp. DW145]
MVQITRRTTASFALLALVPLSAQAKTKAIDAVVSSKAEPGSYSTLQAAVDAAPQGMTTPFRIAIRAGTFAAQTTVRRANIEIYGAGIGKTVLSNDAYAGKLAPDGKPYGTFRTATLNVLAPGFRIENLTIENAFDAPAEMRRAGGLRADEGGSQQAIALSLGRGSDRAVVRNCHILSHQDTLYCAEGRALFERCLIAGSYDFIFGGATVLFERCEVRSRPRIDPIEGYVAAPSTMIDQSAGLVFSRCRLTADAGVPDYSVFLGRPWRGASITLNGKRVGDPRSVGMAAYLNCYLGRHIAPSGWTRMWYVGSDGNPKTWFEPEEARFREFRNIGPGARGVRRGQTLSVAEAAALSRPHLFGDWDPRSV